MKKMILILALIAHAICVADIATQQSSSPQINLTNNNNPEIKMATTIHIPQDDPKDCKNLQGKRLRECMACQTPEKYRENLQNLDDPTALNYFLNLPFGEYIRVLLKNYNNKDNKPNEKWWQDFLHSRQNPELFPVSLAQQRRKAQKIVIQALYPKGSLSEPLYFISTQSARRHEDLEKCIKQYYEALTKNNGTLLHVLPQGHMQQEFEIVKQRLFGQPLED